jgi:hypothetical protein
MDFKLKDGTGNGVNAKVGADNRLQVRAISETEVVHNGELGNAYNFNTGMISVSGDATLIYLKNNADEALIIGAIALGIFEGGTYSDDPYLTVVRNPTGGDIVTDATAITVSGNRNCGSSKEAEADIYKGKTSGTMTGGSDLALLQATPGGRSYYGIDLILPKGASIGIKLDANLSSGSMNVYAVLIGYYKDNIDSK